MTAEDADFVVVGAGYAGLNAARVLKGAGRTVTVLEARDRVGGRVWTIEHDDGTPLDVGGQWIGPTQERIIALTRALDVETFPTYSDGKNVLRLRDRNRRYKGTIPNVGPFSLLNIGWAMWRLSAMAKEVPLEAPWAAPRAREWDEQTLASWMKRNIHFKTARDLLTVGLETVYSASSADLSLLHALFFIHSAGKLDHLLDVRGGAQQDRFVTGAQTVANKMAEALGGAVRLSSPVTRIVNDTDAVTVHAGEVAVRARRVIVAVPPALAGRLDYSPSLPGYRDQLTQRMPMGSVIKCMAIYDRAFWRDEGLSGQAVSDAGPVSVTFDNSPPSGKPGVLMGFVEADAARKLGRLREADRREAVLACFSRYFGDRAKVPLAYVDKSWADEPWSRGCYVAFMPTGVWTSYGPALREPVGRIHWAGTETATVWNGYIDGALESGERAAREVLRAEGLKVE